MLKFLFIPVIAFLAFAILPSYAYPAMNDTGYTIEKFADGICCSPTTMAFEGNDILVLSKESGDVHLIRNGTVQDKPVLHEHVINVGEQGMLGITTVGTKVYLYFTAASDNGTPLGKRVYSYDWDGQNLVHKTLVENFPDMQVYHNGGAMTTDKNGTVYLVMGDAGVFGHNQNHPWGDSGHTSAIYNVNTGQDYAIGIRNSFGLTIDPVNGKLWDTENGPDYGDEINIVPPKFNSGWDILMGPANQTQLNQLAEINPNYTYHNPQFTWWKTIAPTGIAITDANGFGRLYDTVFVGDCNNGNLYQFHLNQYRNGFVFNNTQLTDKVLNEGDSMNEIMFASGLGCITDVVFGPDSNLYVVSISDGAIYRISPQSSTVPEFSTTTLILGISIISVIIISMRSRFTGL